MAQYIFEVLSLDAVTPEGLTRTRLQGVAIRQVRFTVETNPVRLRYDGGAPTAAVGHLYAVGATYELEGADLVRELRFISTTLTASVTVTGEAQ